VYRRHRAGRKRGNAGLPGSGMKCRHQIIALDSDLFIALHRPPRAGRLRHHYLRPNNSAPPPSAGPTVGSIDSGFLAISVWVVRINPATEAALRTAL
jgi:hypothetical protein